jgi:hypothetical protein
MRSRVWQRIPVPASGTGANYAEYVGEISGDPQDRLQALLDEKDAREWHLVGVAGGLEGGGMILFSDTERPSFGRRSR